MDGSKALRAALAAVFGTQNPVERCRHHQVENGRGDLPEPRKEPVQAALRAAFRLPAAAGMARREKPAQGLERGYPDAAARWREGWAERFTVHRGGLSPALGRCLSSTHLIASPHSGVRWRTRRIGRWRDGRRVLRWADAAYWITEKSFGKRQGYRDLWMRKAVREEKQFSVREQVA